MDLLKQVCFVLAFFLISSTYSQNVPELSLLKKGLEYALQGKYKKAAVSFKKLRKNFPDAKIPKYCLTIINDAQNNIIKHKTAIYLFRSIFQSINLNHDLVMHNITKALKLNPKYPISYIFRGHSYSYKKKYDRSINDYSKALQLSSNYAEVYVYRGTTYIDKGEFEKSIKDFNKAIKINPKDSSAYYQRGEAYYEKKQFRRAIEDYKKTISLDPKFIEAYYARGIAYTKANQFNQAINDFSKVIKRDRLHEYSYIHRGYVYRLKGQLDLALRDYNKAIEIKPNSSDVYFRRADVYYEKGQLNQAIKDYRTAIKLNPKHAESYLYRGTAFQKKKQLKLALTDYNKAIKIRPKYVKAYYERGVLYHNNAQYDLAINDYSRVIVLRPRHVNAYRYRGYVYNRQGKFDQAIHDMRKTIDLSEKEITDHRNKKSVSLEKLGAGRRGLKVNITLFGSKHQFKHLEKLRKKTNGLMDKIKMATGRPAESKLEKEYFQYRLFVHKILKDNQIIIKEQKAVVSKILIMQSAGKKYKYGIEKTKEGLEEILNEKYSLYQRLDKAFKLVKMKNHKKVLDDIRLLIYRPPVYLYYKNKISSNDIYPLENYDLALLSNFYISKMLQKAKHKSITNGSKQFTDRLVIMIRQMMSSRKYPPESDINAALKLYGNKSISKKLVDKNVRAILDSFFKIIKELSEKREQVFAKRIGNIGDNNIIVVLGASHIKPLYKLLNNPNYTVKLIFAKDLIDLFRLR